MCRLRIDTLHAPTEFHEQTWKSTGKFDFLCQVLGSGYKVGYPGGLRKEVTSAWELKVQTRERGCAEADRIPSLWEALPKEHLRPGSPGIKP